MAVKITNNVSHFRLLRDWRKAIYLLTNKYSFLIKSLYTSKIFLRNHGRNQTQ